MTRSSIDERPKEPTHCPGEKEEKESKNKCQRKIIHQKTWCFEADENGDHWSSCKTSLTSGQWALNITKQQSTVHSKDMRLESI